MDEKKKIKTFQEELCRVSVYEALKGVKTVPDLTACDSHVGNYWLVMVRTSLHPSLKSSLLSGNHI